MDQPNKDELTLMRKINLIFRFSYTLPFLMASVCGAVYAIPYDVPAYVLILMPLAVLFMAIFVNFSNDYFDHKSGIDSLVHEQRFKAAQKNMLDSNMMKKIYWEGNQFDTGLVTEKQGKAIIVGLLVIIVLLAIPVIVYSGLPVIVFGVIGVFLAYFYSAPPLNFSSRGLGEVTVAISFFMMSFCTFYVATGVWNVEILLFSVAIGIIVGLMRLVDSMSAQDAHIEKGELCLSVRIGLDRTVKVVKTFTVIAYVIIAVMCYFNLLNVFLFLTLLLTSKQWRKMNAKGENWVVSIIPYSFGFSLLTEILFLIVTIVTMVTGNVVFW